MLPTNKPLGTRQLDRLLAGRCRHPRCVKALNPARDRVYFGPECHQGEPMWVHYVAGTIVVQCSACRRTVVRIRPAVEGGAPGRRVPGRSRP